MLVAPGVGAAEAVGPGEGGFEAVGVGTGTDEDVGVGLGAADEVGFGEGVLPPGEEVGFGEDVAGGGPPGAEVDGVVTGGFVPPPPPPQAASEMRPIRAAAALAARRRRIESLKQIWLVEVHPTPSPGVHSRSAGPPERGKKRARRGTFGPLGLWNPNAESGCSRGCRRTRGAFEAVSKSGDPQPERVSRERHDCPFAS